MNEKKYTINIGDFTFGEDVYEDRCLSASFGGSGVQTDAIPWEGTEHNPWDYKALYETETVTVTDEEGNESEEQKKVYTGEFVLDVIEMPEPVVEPSQLDRIEAQVFWTGLMTDTLIAGEE